MATGAAADKMSGAGAGALVYFGFSFPPPTRCRCVLYYPGFLHAAVSSPQACGICMASHKTVHLGQNISTGTVEIKPKGVHITVTYLGQRNR